MALDRNGRELQPGDRFVIRGVVKEVYPTEDNALLSVEYETEVPLLGYVRAERIEKVVTEEAPEEGEQ